MKVVLAGEAFDFDGSRKPMAEALAVEKAWGRRYAEWETELAAGSAEAYCVLAWLIWRREGRDVELKDILEGKVDFDFGEMLRSFITAAEEEAKAAEPVPTSGAAPLTVPDGTAMTSASTSARSRRSSGSGPGKSAS